MTCGLIAPMKPIAQLPGQARKYDEMRAGRNDIIHALVRFIVEEVTAATEKTLVVFTDRTE